jgi:hypothetical protein
MSKNVIAISAWRRPEFLYIYLNQLSKNKTYKNYKLLFCVDKDPDPGIYEVIDQFDHPDKEVITRKERVSACPAAFNILDSYLLASERTKDFVIIGEEDIIPSEDFLKFCEYSYTEILSKYDRIFCIAHKRRQDPQDGKVDVLMGDTQCTSPFLITKKCIEKYMRPELSEPHVYSNPFLHNYLNHNKSRIAYNEHYDHDGAIERIIEKNKLFALKPDQARTAHVGVYGGFSFKNENADWKTRYESLSESIFNQKKLSDLRDKLDNRESKTEVATCSLSNYEWDSLILDTDRILSISSSWWYDPQNDFKKYVETSMGMQVQ